MLTNRVGMMLDDRVKYDVNFTEASVECLHRCFCTQQMFLNNKIS